MKFKVPKIPEGINTSKTHPLKDFLGLFFNSVLLLGGIYIFIYFLSFTFASIIPLKWENKIGLYLSSEGKNPQQISQLTHQLWKASTSFTEITFPIDIMKSSQPNAFMAPGGFMTLTKGLLKNVQSENELAFVLCHEMGHFYHRHSIQQLGTHLFQLILSSSLESSTHLLTQLMSLKHSRSHETQADEFAARCMNAHYGHIAGFDHFFKKIKSSESSLKVLNYWSTHPLSDHRIEHLKKYAQSQGFSLQGKLKKWPIDAAQSP